ncbi:type II secretion system minor pseudopilin GspI [Motiliproteus coralliicola]|uniref:type II secretion system minor pseudopilin GspI n=1 Tax=Motiliproteus coralliicola TaxID=2283196 RepID=UPI001403C95A|nr:type II secretion system minor pseudopilin GspI [Motiliproteus coralliicola]
MEIDSENQQGFTLIELLVAVAIVGFALSALLINVMGNIGGSEHLRNKTIANWVAMNQLELAQINNRYFGQLPLGVETGTEIMAGQEWFWQLRTTQTPDRAFFRVEVTVYGNSSTDKAPMAYLQGALGNFER